MFILIINFFNALVNLNYQYYDYNFVEYFSDNYLINLYCFECLPYYEFIINYLLELLSIFFNLITNISHSFPLVKI